MVSALNQHIITGRVSYINDIRYSQKGDAFLSFGIVYNTRFLNRQTNEWQDGDTISYKVTAWRQEAENAAQSLQKGVEVTVVGSSVTADVYNEKASANITADRIYVPLAHQVINFVNTKAYGNKTQNNSNYTPAPNQNSYHAPSVAAASDDEPF
jgi:single-strand DNA-binding protein